MHNKNDAIETVVQFDLQPVLDTIPTKKYKLYQEEESSLNNTSDNNSKSLSEGF